MFEFERAIPEETGISSKKILNILKELDQKEVPMHSLIIMRKDKLIFEKYYAPYEANTLHRMFSITKSFTALAIFLLAQEGRLSLDDRICDYFPEYVTADTHEYIRMMTIRNLLEMRTCHASTTYNVNMKSDWVESFFIVPPTHKPGTVFHYDTSAAHTLCALAEKLTGGDMLDYLKDRLLKHVDFSTNSYLVKDPFGVSIGGSGLMATPMDILKVLYILDKEGTIRCSDGQVRTLLSKELIEEATSNISDTLMTGPLPSESQGYGMQIWRNEKGGFVMYGMGGQLAISIPSEDILVMTTADTQGMQGGNQVIYDTMYSNLTDAGISVSESSADSAVSYSDADAACSDTDAVCSDADACCSDLNTATESGTDTAVTLCEKSGIETMTTNSSPHMITETIASDPVMHTTTGIKTAGSAFDELTSYAETLAIAPPRLPAGYQYGSNSSLAYRNPVEDPAGYLSGSNSSFAYRNPAEDPAAIPSFIRKMAEKSSLSDESTSCETTSDEITYDETTSDELTSDETIFDRIIYDGTTSGKITYDATTSDCTASNEIAASHQGSTSPLRLRYALAENPSGFDTLSLSLSDEGESFIEFMQKEKPCRILFGLNKMLQGSFPIYDTPYTAGAIFTRENNLYIRAHLIGESVGSVRFQLYFEPGEVTVFMRKIEETYFKEFEGHLQGRLI